MTSAAVRRIPLVKPDLPPYAALAPWFESIVAAGRLTNFGPMATRFEALTGARLGVQAVSVASGTTGLVLALQALGVGPGSCVALPGYTFTATAQALMYLGATPVFVDVDASLTMDPACLADLLHRRDDIAAVIGVHVHGHPCDVEALQSVVAAAAARRGAAIALLYDAAHAFGAAVNGQPVGSFGDAEVFSLSVTKALVCGEGGLITTASPALVRQLKAMRNYGIEAAYDATLPGLNGKLGELHAAIGCKNLELLDEVLAQRARKAALYKTLLEGIDGLSLPAVKAGITHTWKDFTVLLPAGKAARRAELGAMLQVAGIETRAYFSPAVHQQGHFRRFATEPLPRTEDASARVLTLPFYTAIPDDDLRRVAQQLALALGAYERDPP